MTVKDTTAMIAGMTPVLMPGGWVYCCETDARRAAEMSGDAFATMHEAEGITLILPEPVAKAQGYDTSLVMRQITLNVFSDLEGVGLTAAVAAALTDIDVSCNVVAGYHHDHVFVPEADADRALKVLQDRQRAAEIQSESAGGTGQT
ncbi:MAG: ACT domain-containing protein [Pseudomonadota bacterium]